MYIKVKAFPNSKKESIQKITEDKFEIKVREKAQMNMANKRIIELVAQYFDLPVGKVRILNGHQSPSKLLSVDLEES